MLVHNNEGQVVEVELKNVLCVPGYESNLLSVPTSAARDVSFEFNGKSGSIRLSDGTVLPIRAQKSLYVLDVEFAEGKCFAALKRTQLTMNCGTDV